MAFPSFMLSHSFSFFFFFYLHFIQLFFSSLPVVALHIVWLCSRLIALCALEEDTIHCCEKCLDNQVLDDTERSVYGCVRQTCDMEETSGIRARFTDAFRFSVQPLCNLFFIIWLPHRPKKHVCRFLRCMYQLQNYNSQTVKL